MNSFLTRHLKKISIGMVMVTLIILVFAPIIKTQIQVSQDPVFIFPVPSARLIGKLSSSSNDPKNVAHRAQEYLRIVPEGTALSKNSVSYLHSLLESDSRSREAFQHSFDIFSGRAGEYPAARYLAMMSQLGGDDRFAYLMKWTQQDLQENSRQIMSVLEKEQLKIFSKPKFIEGFVNLVQQLSIPQDQKSAFYFDVMRRGIHLEANGDISPDTLSFETALAMAKQNNVSGLKIYQVMNDVIHQSSAPVRQALVARLVEYYPELQGKL